MDVNRLIQNSPPYYVSLQHLHNAAAMCGYLYIIIIHLRVTLLAVFWECVNILRKSIWKPGTILVICEFISVRLVLKLSFVSIHS